MGFRIELVLRLLILKTSHYSLNATSVRTVCGLWQVEFLLDWLTALVGISPEWWLPALGCKKALNPDSYKVPPGRTKGAP